MPLDDVEQPGQKYLQGLTVISRAYITIGGMEEPETRVGGVLKAGGLSFGKHIRNQAIAYVLGKAAENVFAFMGASCGNGEAFEGNHCFAAPVGEPMVSSDGGADFITNAMGLNGFRCAPDGTDKKLVRCMHKFRCQARARFLRRGTISLRGNLPSDGKPEHSGLDLPAPDGEAA